MQTDGQTDYLEAEREPEGLDESIMPYPRIFLFFMLYGSVLQDYLNNNEPDANGKHITVDDVLKVLTGRYSGNEHGGD